VNIFRIYVFFSGDRQPAAIDLIRASFLLAEIDSRQHAAGQPPVHAARGDYSPVWEVDSTRTRLGGTRSGLVPVCAVQP
jgi:hypothetical protein